jgi:hypothetical protein
MWAPTSDVIVTTACDRSSSNVYRQLASLTPANLEHPHVRRDTLPGKGRSHLRRNFSSLAASSKQPSAPAASQHGRRTTIHFDDEQPADTRSRAERQLCTWSEFSCSHARRGHRQSARLCSAYTCMPSERLCSGSMHALLQSLCGGATYWRNSCNLLLLQGRLLAALQLGLPLAAPFARSLSACKQASMQLHAFLLACGGAPEAGSRAGARDHEGRHSAEVAAVEDTNKKRYTQEGAANTQRRRTPGVNETACEQPQRAVVRHVLRRHTQRPGQRRPGSVSPERRGTSPMEVGAHRCCWRLQRADATQRPQREQCGNGERRGRPSTHTE